MLRYKVVGQCVFMYFCQISLRASPIMHHYEAILTHPVGLVFYLVFDVWCWNKLLPSRPLIVFTWQWRIYNLSINNRINNMYRLFIFYFNLYLMTRTHNLKHLHINLAKSYSILEDKPYLVVFSTILRIWEYF